MANPPSFSNCLTAIDRLVRSWLYFFRDDKLAQLLQKDPAYLDESCPLTTNLKSSVKLAKRRSVSRVAAAATMNLNAFQSVRPLSGRLTAPAEGLLMGRQRTVRFGHQTR